MERRRESHSESEDESLRPSAEEFKPLVQTNDPNRCRGIKNHHYQPFPGRSLIFCQWCGRLRHIPDYVPRV